MEIDRRVEDSKTVRFTVVSYSDGSSESITQMKADELVANITKQLVRQAEEAGQPRAAPTSLNEKGMFIDKSA